MSEVTEQHRIDRLIVDSDPIARFVAALAYRCAAHLPIADNESLHKALRNGGALRLGPGEVSVEQLPKVPDHILPIRDLPDLIAKARTAVVFLRTANERGVFASEPVLRDLANAVTVATAPVDVPTPIFVARRGLASPERKGKAR